MKQFDYVVQSPVGIHARPAMLLAQKARTFTSIVRIEYNGKYANAKNMAELLLLGVFQAAKVTFIVEGEKEEEEVQQLKEFCEHNL